MAFLAPYASYMKLGQGFNSYTQEICIEDAVSIAPRVAPTPSVAEPSSPPTINGNVPTGGSPAAVSASPPKDATPNSTKTLAAETAAASSVVEKAPPPARNLSQIVTYSSRLVSNMADIVDALNISASASIKYGTVKGSGSASFVNENKVSQSDLNYIITVKVTNAVQTYPDTMRFNPIDGLDPKDFTEVFGDCFISGFLEGGEFSAIISIKVYDKSKISEVKAAAEVDLAIAPVPGLTVGASASMDKKKSSVWGDTETTISEPAAKWDLATVVDVASRFPHLIESSSQRTSAILTKYSSLRSWVTENAKLISKGGKDAGYVIRDYGFCQIYTMDLFSAYMAYKALWNNISEMMKHMSRFQELEPSKEVPDPVLLSPDGLNKARLLVRKQLTLIAAENARLVTNPELASVNDETEQRPAAFSNPAELKSRLPKRESPAGNNTFLTSEEFKAIGDIEQQEQSYHLSPLSGDLTSASTNWLKRGKKTIFRTIDTTQDPKMVYGLTKLTLHAHEHHHGDIFADLHQHSKSSQGYLSGIGFSTSKDANTKPRADGTHHVVGRPNDNRLFWSQPADLTISRVAHVVVEYVPGSERIASLILLDGARNEIVSWKQYGQAQIAKPAGLRVDEQSPPDARGGWLLAGFWGHADAVVITSISAIWKRVNTGRPSLAASLVTGLPIGGLDGVTDSPATEIAAAA